MSCFGSAPISEQEGVGGFKGNHWKLVRVGGLSPAAAAAMMFGIVSLCGALMFCWVCADGRQLPPGQNPAAAGQKETCTLVR